MANFPSISLESSNQFRRKYSQSCHQTIEKTVESSHEQNPSRRTSRTYLPTSQAADVFASSKLSRSRIGSLLRVNNIYDTRPNDFDDDDDDDAGDDDDSVLRENASNTHFHPLPG